MIMRRLSLLLTCFIAVLFSAGPAHTDARSREIVTDNAVSRLFSEQAGIVPGESVVIGFHQKLRDGWHVYWSNPGDSGLPLVLKWTLPEAFSAGDIWYPVPHRLPLDTLINYGHEGEPTFLIEITAPANAEPGTNVTFSVDATWLICDDICVPEQGILEISLPVVSESLGPDPEGEFIIGAARQRLPVEADFTADFFDADGVPVLRLNTDLFDQEDETHFFPFVPSLIEPGGNEIVTTDGDGLTIQFTKGFEYDPSTIEKFDGVVTTGSGADTQGFVVRATKIDAPADFVVAAAPSRSTPTTVGQSSAPGLFGILWFAFLGGIILNVMPCVFPVVFIKAASLASAAHEDRGAIRTQGLLYTVGVLATFVALAGILIALRTAGEQIGWGFHLQSPMMVSVFAVVILLVGLNLAGLFEVATSVQGLGSGLAARNGNLGAFFTGLLAVAVAAPCIGPFLGVPVGFALTQPAAIGLSVFAVMGLGLALPYLLISLIPALAGLLPKPGAWMETFKQLLSFAMFATLIWLIWTLTLQAGTDGLVLLLCALLIVGFAAWVYGNGQRAGGGLTSRLLALAALIGAGVVIADIQPQPRSAIRTFSLPGEGDLSELPTAIFSQVDLAELRTAGTPVFVDFTAAWCVTCQVNKQRVLKRADIINAFHENGVVYMVADWTLQDPAITRALEAQGRSGVPLYLFYAPGAENPAVLPQMLSVKLMLETLSGL